MSDEQPKELVRAFLQHELIFLVSRAVLDDPAFQSRHGQGQHAFRVEFHHDENNQLTGASVYRYLPQAPKPKLKAVDGKKKDGANESTESAED